MALALPATPRSTPFGSKAEPRPLTAVELEEGRLGVTPEQLMWAEAAYFYARLRDEAGRPLIVELHQEEWIGHMQECPLLCLLAPRDHGKTYTAVAYLLWRAWRHNRDPVTAQIIEDLPDGRYQAVVFSEILPQAENLFGTFQSLLIANEHIFGDIMPSFGAAGRRRRGQWSQRRIRMRNLFEISIRAYRTSTRGLHPQLIVCDDVLSDKNSQTAYQRGKVWDYFASVLIPMNAEQIIVIGTAQHYDDLLHRLRPDPKKAALVMHGRRARFKWLRYKAVHWDSGEVLWKGRHPLDELIALRDLDAVMFSREYQNDPRDDAASLFPYTLTSLALKRGADFDFLPLVPGIFRPAADEWVVLAADFALSEEVGADFTVCGVAVVNRWTLDRRVLWASREKGLRFQQQIDQLRAACVAFGVNLGVLEDNGFQKWVHTETMLYPETVGRLVGHKTGREKGDLAMGVPSLKIGLQQEKWIMPSGSEQARAFAHIWQSEMSAFGWKDDKLQGVGEHDDTVMWFWLLDRAVRMLQDWQISGPDEQIVTGQEVGIDRVKIATDY